MAVEILWFVDRFGIRGNYYQEWLRLLHTSGLKPAMIRTVNLHERIRGTLLMKYMTRKAPTWIPERQADIINAMKREIDACGPGLKAIVLAAPETLAAVGLNPEHATLSKLRGSVYEVAGIPAVVMLPMSTWFSTVSQKDVQLANYGAGSADYMERMANAKSAQDVRDGSLDSRGHDDSDSGNQAAPAGQSRLALQRGAVVHDGGRLDGGAGGNSLGTRHEGLTDVGTTQLGHGAEMAADDAGDESVDTAYDAESAAGDFDSTGGAGYDEDGMADDIQPDDAGLDVSGDDESTDGDDQDSDEEALDDNFFYVPIVTPVGRFMITCDTAKLARIAGGRAGERFPPPKLY